LVENLIYKLWDDAHVKVVDDKDDYISKIVEVFQGVDDTKYFLLLNGFTEPCILQLKLINILSTTSVCYNKKLRVTTILIAL